MNETLLWLLYLAGAAVAFWVVRHRGWPLTLAILLPSVAGTMIYYLAVELGKEANEPFWFNVDIAMNFSFFLIFAGAGAAIGMFLRDRQNPPVEADVVD